MNTNQYYFAYGSNMDPTQMEHRCPAAVPVGLGVLSGFRLTFDYWSKRRKCYVADIVSEPVEASNVWGVLWFVTNSDLVALDGYEGVSTGSYRRITVKPSVFGISVEAYAYQVKSPEAVSYTHLRAHET